MKKSAKIIVRVPVFIALIGPLAVCLPNLDSGNMYQEQLILARAGVATWALRCDGAAAKEDTSAAFCAEDNFQGDYDATLWNGLLCASGGEEWACQAVRDSQSADGRVWRSPRLMLIENGDIDRPSFSRDMALGVLAYLVHTRDVRFGNAWSSYIEDKGALCPEVADTCWVGPQLYWLFNHVAEKVGFRKIPPGTVVFFKGDSGFLKEGYSRAAEDAALFIQVMGLGLGESAARGFEFHLLGTHLYILKRLDHWSELNQATAELLSDSQPRNPFYRYLAGEGVNTLAPDLLSIVPPLPPRIRYQWTLEKKDEELNWLLISDQSMGWEFIFMLNLLLLQPNEDTRFERFDFLNL